MTISYDELAALAGNHAMADTACPLVVPAVDRRQIASVASSASGTLSPGSPLIVAPGAVKKKKRGVPRRA